MIVKEKIEELVDRVNQLEQKVRLLEIQIQDAARPDHFAWPLVVFALLVVGATIYFVWRRSRAVDRLTENAYNRASEDSIKQRARYYQKDTFE